MIETDAELSVGETIGFDLPAAGPTEANIIWKRGTYFGCEFVASVPKAAISAALLQAPIVSPDSADTPRVEEVPVAIKPTLEEMEAWRSEFEKTKGTTGDQLIGFRQTSDGLVIAIVAKMH